MRITTTHRRTIAIVLGCVNFCTSAGELPTGCTRPIVIAASPLGRAMVIDDAGYVSGYTRDIVDKIAKDTGCAFRFHVVPRPRAFMMLKSGEVDIVTDATLTDDRSQNSRFIELGTVEIALISLAGNPVQSMDLKALIQSDVALIGISGYSYDKEYESLVTDLKSKQRFSTAPTPEHAIKMLLAKRGQAILASPSTLIDAWERFGQQKPLHVTKLEGMPTTKYGWYFSISRMPERDIATVSKAIQALTQSGEARKLSFYHFPEWFKEAFRAVPKEPNR